ncbi:hypothetical protein BS297_27345 [Rhodococcus erythropolis]|uniref:Uncharacterized protein n=1 Tax=Rhodococcus erythropolis TaxID=1833 RepID=A0A0C3ABQ6_RHOER|nr:hypothetical protein BS297_27345 [Rhodococcus erythropolis]KIM17509.1 hypothetical protein QV65_04545 [Rhodococcus erythropolis]
MANAPHTIADDPWFSPEDAVRSASVSSLLPKGLLHSAEQSSQSNHSTELAVNASTTPRSLPSSLTTIR